MQPSDDVMKKSVRSPRGSDTQAILTHWQEAVPNDRLAHLVKDVTRAFVRALQARLSEHSVSFGHWAFLRILWERDGLNQRELSDQAGVMEPTTFAAIQAMEKLGYVTRTQRPGDRRMVFIHLTAKGRSLKNKLVPLAEAVNGIGIRGVKTADVTITRRTLLAILDNLAVDEAQSVSPQRRIPPPVRQPATRFESKT
jgi:MarR family transcriptional regulator, organic hydroperoxide resistance regulator